MLVIINRLGAERFPGLCMSNRGSGVLGIEVSFPLNKKVLKAQRLPPVDSLKRRVTNQHEILLPVKPFLVPCDLLRLGKLR